jgi:hypothetical protein
MPSILELTTNFLKSKVVDKIEQYKFSSAREYSDNMGIKVMVGELLNQTVVQLTNFSAGLRCCGFKPPLR